MIKFREKWQIFLIARLRLRRNRNWIGIGRTWRLDQCCRNRMNAWSKKQPEVWSTSVHVLSGLPEARSVGISPRRLVLGLCRWDNGPWMSVVVSRVLLRAFFSHRGGALDRVPSRGISSAKNASYYVKLRVIHWSWLLEIDFSFYLNFFSIGERKL